VYVLQIVVCPFVLFLLAIVLSVLLRYTDSDYPFGIFKLFIRIFQNPHPIHTTNGVANVIVTLKRVLTTDRIDFNNLERGFLEHYADPAI
jgi:hypothetical protein